MMGRPPTLGEMAETAEAVRSSYMEVKFNGTHLHSNRGPDAHGLWKSCVVCGRRFYVRFRVWNRHQKKGCWYPTKRGFIIPLQRAEALADSLLDAVNGRTSEKPGWLLGWEEEEERKRFGV